MADMRPTTILVIGDIPDIMSAIVHCPVRAHQLQNVRGIRLRCRQRRHTKGDVMGHLARRDGVSPPLNPCDVCAANHRDAMRVLWGAHIQHRAPPPFPPPVALIKGLMNAHTVIPRHRWQLRQHGRLVVFDRRHHIIRTTVRDTHLGRRRRARVRHQGAPSGRSCLRIKPVPVPR